MTEIKWTDGTRKPCVVLDGPKDFARYERGNGRKHGGNIIIKKYLVSYIGRDGKKYVRWVTGKRINGKAH